MNDYKIFIDGKEYKLNLRGKGSNTAEPEVIFDGYRYVGIEIPKPKSVHKNWEVLVIRHKNTGFLSNYEHPSKYQDNRYYSIHSVRRISDMEVFAVGDETKIGIITHFIIVGQEMVAKNTNGNFSNINFLTKKEKRKLFTTADGKDIYEGDTVCLLSEDTWLTSYPINAPASPFYGDKNQFKYFSTKDAANDYILNNKPCLSFNEVRQSIKSGCTSTFDEDSYKWIWYVDPTQLMRYIKKLVKRKTQ